MNISNTHIPSKNNYVKPTTHISNWIKSVSSKLETQTETEEKERIKRNIDIALRAQVLNTALNHPEPQRSVSTELVVNTTTSQVSVTSLKESVQKKQRELSELLSQPVLEDISSNTPIRQRPIALVSALREKEEEYEKAIKNRVTNQQELRSRRRRTHHTSLTPQTPYTTTHNTEALSKVCELLKEQRIQQAEVNRLSDTEQQSERTVKLLQNTAHHLETELASLKKKNEEFETQIQKYQRHIAIIDQKNRELKNSLENFENNITDTFDQAVANKNDNSQKIKDTIQNSTTTITNHTESILEQIEKEIKTLNEAKESLKTSVTNANKEANKEIDKLAVSGKTFRIKIEYEGHTEYLYSPTPDRKDLRVNQRKTDSDKFALTYSESVCQVYWELFHQYGDTYKIKNTSDGYYLYKSNKDVLDKGSYCHVVTSERDRKEADWQITQVSDTEFTIMQDGEYLNILGNPRLRPKVEWRGPYFGPRDEVEVWQGSDQIEYHSDDDRRSVVISSNCHSWIIEEN